MSGLLPPDEPDGYLTRTTCPSGDFVWTVAPEEWAPSQWVLAGELWRKNPPAGLFKPPEDWSFEDRDWISSGTLKLEGRRYPGIMPGITLTLDVKRLTGIVEVDAGDRRLGASNPPGAPAGQQIFSDLLSWLAAYPTR